MSLRARPDAEVQARSAPASADPAGVATAPRPLARSGSTAPADQRGVGATAPPLGRIAVVGGGIAGVSAALFLAGIGAEVVLFERRARPAFDAAGLLLQPNGQAVLDVIEPGFARRLGGVPIHRWYGEDHAGRVVLDLRYDRWRPGSHALGVQRGVLHAALWALLQGAGTRIVTGVAVTAVDQDDDSVTLSFEAPAIPGSGPGHPERYDGVVLADGFGSTLRANCGFEHRAEPAEWGLLWTTLRDPHRRFVGTYEQRVGEDGTLLGVMPTGRPGADDEVTLTWAIRADRVDAWRGQDIDVWKARATRLWPWIAPLLEPVTGTGRFTFEPFAEVRMSRWHRRRIVVVGDAAHATEPHLRQGANQALVDATTLAYSAGASYGRWPDAFERFSDVRRANVHFHQRASRVVASSMRRTTIGARLMQWGLRRPALQSMAVQTVAGVRQGLFRPPIRLPGDVATEDDLD